MNTLTVAALETVPSEEIAKTIIFTVAYFDILKYPLTVFEIWKYALCEPYCPVSGKSIRKVPLFRFITEADLLVEKHILEKCDGRYVLFGNSAIISKHSEKIKLSMLKLKRIRRIVYWLRMLPFIRMIAITGRLALKNIGKTSDWDVLVILEKKHIWIGRTFLTVFLHIIRKRRWGKRAKDRFCLNYFITNELLEISVHDLFAAKEYAFTIPLCGEKTFVLFEKKNTWIRNFFPRWNISLERTQLLIQENKGISLIQKIIEVIFDSRWLEETLGKLQKEKIQRNPKTYRPESYIVADDTSLIFLPDPHGPKVFEAFYEKLQELRVV